jgi:hypothetical protein
MISQSALARATPLLAGRESSELRFQSLAAVLRWAIWSFVLK